MSNNRVKENVYLNTQVAPINNINREKTKTSKSVLNVLDLGVSGFMIHYPNMFNHVGGYKEILKNKKSGLGQHRFFADQIVKNTSTNDVKSILKNSKIDSNIRMLLVISLYENKTKINEDIINSLDSNMITINKREDNVIIAHSNLDSYVYKLVLFKNGFVYMGSTLDIIEDEENKGNFIYTLDYGRKVDSSGKKIN